MSSSSDYPTSSPLHPASSWGNAGPRADEDDVDEVEQDDDEGVDLEVEVTYLDTAQLARVEALGHARTALLVGGFLGNTPKLEPWALTYLAEWVLKGPEQGADEGGGTDAETDAPTDGGSTGPTIDVR